MKGSVTSSNGVPIPSAAKAMSSTTTRPVSVRGSGSCRGVVNRMSGWTGVDPSITANVRRDARAVKTGACREQLYRENRAAGRSSRNPLLGHGLLERLVAGGAPFHPLPKALEIHQRPHRGVVVLHAGQASHERQRARWF